MSSLQIPLAPFYFIRHGETDWNRRKIVMGSQDIPLNEVGLQQAQMASYLLEHESFDIIVSSPKIRARKTAEIIAHKTNKPLVFEDGLAEITWGEGEGQPVDLSRSLFDDATKSRGAETFVAFQNRVVEAVSSVLILGKLPLIVSHGGVFAALTHHMGYKDLSSSNCVPFFFKPPLDPAHPWGVSSLGENKISCKTNS
jgi:broad specificity phosphatase PhoE